MSWKRQLKVTIELFIDAPDDRLLAPLVDEAIAEMLTMGGADTISCRALVPMRNGVSIRVTPENEYRDNGVPILIKEKKH